jgi:hypothetical protein
LKNKRIAILGAGGLGVCTALELANRGYLVDLYEENNAPVKKASYVQEGKIHLGLIYAMDRDLHTAKEMINGALHFISYLKRWIEINPEDIISTPFYYGVHTGSLMSPEEVSVHYQRCSEYFTTARNHFKKDYLDLFESLEVSRLPNSQIGDIANPEYMSAVFQTSEYAVEPRIISEKLTEAVTSHPNVNLFLNTKITAVSDHGNSLKVHFLRDSIPDSERYPEVINATWNGLLAIDKTMGIEPPQKWSHRYKFGNKVFIPLKPDDLPSLTIVQGPFGDTVNFKDRGLFMSWYPVGRTGWSEDYRAPEWDSHYSEEERMEVFEKSLAEIALRIPALNKLKFEPQDISPVGGVIYAHGNKDVDSAESKLHTRFEVGMRSFGNYHTVNTGKYTIIPLLAVNIANQISGKPLN